MAFTPVEAKYLAGQRRGRLATVAPDGTPQNKPVGFVHNAELDTIDIHGYAMESSWRFRGRAEAASLAVPPSEGMSTSFIRIHPRRIVAYNIDPDRPGFHGRDAGR